jgi:hypothetical protein
MTSSKAPPAPNATHAQPLHVPTPLKRRLWCAADGLLYAALALAVLVAAVKTTPWPPTLAPHQRALVREAAGAGGEDMFSRSPASAGAGGSDLYLDAVREADERARASHAAGRYEEASKIIDAVLQHARTLPNRARSRDVDAELAALAEFRERILTSCLEELITIVERGDNPTFTCWRIYDVDY